MDENDQQRDEEVEEQGYKGFRREAEGSKESEDGLEVEEQGRRSIAHEEADESEVEEQGRKGIAREEADESEVEEQGRRLPWA